jgi:NAD(P)-dependent dehydrogenase (short-subunit alcohol dehydrogenase family)
MAEFEGKVAVVTGTANGIGEAVAKEFAARGATVVIADKDAERSKIVEAEILEAGGEALSIVTDVREEKQVQSLIAEVVTRFGKIDVLDNNAAALELAAEDPDVVNLTTDILSHPYRLPVQRILGLQVSDPPYSRKMAAETSSTLPQSPALSEPPR